MAAKAGAAAGGDGRSPVTRAGMGRPGSGHVAGSLRYRPAAQVLTSLQRALGAGLQRVPGPLLPRVNSVAQRARALQ